MRIEGQPPVQRAASPRASSVRRGDGFASLVNAGQAAAASTSAPVGLIGGILPLDAEADAASGRSRGLADGHALLDELEDLRRALMLGDISGGRLTRIAEKLDALPPEPDFALGAIIDEIRLRVAVEIAKLSPAHIAACRSLARPV